VLDDLDPVDVGVDDVADVGQHVVVDLHPVLDAEGSVAHPVVVVGSSGGLRVRGGHHGAGPVNVELRLVPLLHVVEVCLGEAGPAVADEVDGFADLWAAALAGRVEAPRRVVPARVLHRLPAATVGLARVFI